MPCPARIGGAHPTGLLGGYRKNSGDDRAFVLCDGANYDFGAARVLLDKIFTDGFNH